MSDDELIIVEVVNGCVTCVYWLANPQLNLMKSGHVVVRDFDLIHAGDPDPLEDF